MEDPSQYIRDMCDHWWSQRTVEDDHALFQEGGPHHLPGQFNVNRCWMWQIHQFLHSTFSCVDHDGITRTFQPKDHPLKERMVYQAMHAETYLEGDPATSLRLLTVALRAQGLDGEALAQRRAR